MSESIGEGDALPDKVMALRAAHPRFVGLVDSSPLVMAAWDDRFRCVAVSDASIRLVHAGRSRDEVIGRSLESLTDPGYRQQLGLDLQQLLDRGHLTARARIVDRNGEVREFSFFASANVLPGMHVTLSWLGADLVAEPVDSGEPTDRIPVLLSAPDALTISFLRASFARHPELDVIAECEGFERLEVKVMGHRPRVTVVAASPFSLPSNTMPGRGLVDVVRQLAEFQQANSIEGGILVVDHHHRPEAASEMLAVGARGVFGPREDLAQLVTAVTMVANGENYVTPSLAISFAKRGRDGSSVLTARELEVLRLLALGYTNRQIAEELFISVRTVENHRASVHRTLALADRRELVSYAIENGIIP